MSRAASPEVIVLTLVATIAGVYAFVCEIREDNRARRMRAWILEHHPDRWRELPWIVQRIAKATIGLRILKRRGLSADPEFAARYAEIMRVERRQLIAIAVIAISITMVFLGIRVLGWVW